MTKTKAWIMATRPKTLTAAAGPVLLGLALSFHFKNSANLLTFTLILITALLLQVGTNLVNDYYDTIRGTDGDDRLGPTRVTQAGLISPEEVKRGFLTVFILATFIGIYLMILGGLPIVIIGILSLILAVSPAIIGSLFWKMKSNAVFLSMLAGVISLIILIITGNFNPDNSIITLPTAIVFLIIGQIIFKKQTPQQHLAPIRTNLNSERYVKLRN